MERSKSIWISMSISVRSQAAAINDPQIWILETDSMFIVRFESVAKGWKAISISNEKSSWESIHCLISKKESALRHYHQMLRRSECWACCTISILKSTNSPKNPPRTQLNCISGGSGGSNRRTKAHIYYASLTKLKSKSQQLQDVQQCRFSCQATKVHDNIRINRRTMWI